MEKNDKGIWKEEKEIVLPVFRFIREGALELNGLKFIHTRLGGKAPVSERDGIELVFQRFDSVVTIESKPTAVAGEMAFISLADKKGGARTYGPASYDKIEAAYKKFALEELVVPKRGNDIEKRTK